MAIKNPSLQRELRDLNESLEQISDLADEALDPELTREEIVSKLKEISELAGSEEEEEN